MKGHPGILNIDHFEPDPMQRALSPAVPTIVVPLNTMGKADYYMVDPQDNERMIERKQIGEAISDLDAVEEQLGRHLHECDELTLLVEGVATPTPKGVQVYRKSGGQFVPGFAYNQPTLWSRWNSFKYSLWHNAGVHVEEVSDWQSSVQFITTWFKKAMDPSSTTLNRYVVPHMPPFHKNPHIDNLCRLKDMGMGEVAATALIAKFGTFYGVMTAPWVELVGVMGGPWTRAFFEAIEREE